MTPENSISSTAGPAGSAEANVSDARSRSSSNVIEAAPTPPARAAVMSSSMARRQTASATSSLGGSRRGDVALDGVERDGVGRVLDGRLDPDRSGERERGEVRLEGHLVALGDDRAGQAVTGRLVAHCGRLTSYS